MKVGRSHKWYYDQGVWKETKITPDEWKVSYAVTKRRAGKAPEGSGVPVGTEYHWYILAHQHVKKLNANDYSTALNGMKFKLAHKRSGNEKWSVTEPTQRKHLIKILKEFIAKLEKEPFSISGLPEEEIAPAASQKVKAAMPIEISADGHSDRKVKLSPKNSINKTSARRKLQKA